MTPAEFAVDLATGETLSLDQVLERIGLSYGDDNTLADLMVVGDEIRQALGGDDAD